MVKTSHKRFVKKEKNKVKIKGNKLLPKGLNRTDTTFKVKKIVIKEQLKEHEQSELLSKKRLNVKELISRLNHHNFGMRQEALFGLKQVLEYYPGEALKLYLPQLIEVSASLSIDREGAIRKDSLILLSSVLNQVSVDQMLPLFPILSSYLVCAMTHIDLTIREDSLNLLDTLLQFAPELLASQADTFLLRFLDLISLQNGDNRTLSLHLGGKISTNKWRATVFYRLQKLLSALKDFNLSKDSSKEPGCRFNQVNSLSWENNSHCFIPLYSNQYFNSGKLSLGKAEGSVIDQIKLSKLKIQEYTEILIPLLLDTFAEVAPYEKNDTVNQHQISVEAAVLLQCIVRIIRILGELMQQCDDKDSVVLWFRQNYGNTIYKRLIDNRFPYTTSQLHAKIVNKKRSKEISALLSAFEISQNIDGECFMQNLGLSHIVLMLSPKNSKTRHLVINYLKNSLRNCGTLDAEQCSLLKNCCEAVCNCNDKLESIPLLKSVVKLWNNYKQLDRPISCTLFDFLTDVAMNYKLKELHRDESFEEWISSLPELLTFSKVPYSKLLKISLIGTCSIPAFSNSLDGWIESILDNVAKVSIEECTDDEALIGRKHIINLLYWVQDWDKDMVKNIGLAIKNNYFGTDLTSHLINILRLRVQKDQFSNLATLLKEEDWWLQINE